MPKLELEITDDLRMTIMAAIPNELLLEEVLARMEGALEPKKRGPGPRGGWGGRPKGSKNKPKDPAAPPPPPEEDDDERLPDVPPPGYKSQA